MKDLYIIHGWTYTVEPWSKTLSLLEKDGYHVEMLHVPGLTKPSQKVWTVEEYARWADRNIPSGAIALGHSNGGRILLNLCQDKPDKLKHLILLDSAGVYEPSRKRDLSRKAAKVLSPLKRIQPLRKVAHKLIGASDYERAPENMKQTLANMLDSDKNLDLTKVTTPATILWGEADTITPLRQAKVLEAKLPNSHLVTRKNWTHAPYICDSTGLARALSSILKGLK